MDSPLALGDIVLGRFPEHVPPGHEQGGPRPALVVGLPGRLGIPRFPLVLLAPLTSDRSQPWAARSPALYHRLPAGSGGLPQDSLVLLDQIRALDLRRVTGYIGSLLPERYGPLAEALRRMIG